ncbi:MAG: hypothetical protein ACYDBO_09305 [Vulcanimicrobiaceae bacterium]
MAPLLTVVAGLFAVGAAAGAYAAFAPRPPRAEGSQPDLEPALEMEPVPIAGRFGEFDALAESARCDLIFSMGAIDDEASRSLLLHALDDPSEAVALAAARAFARAGSIGEVHRYASERPGHRTHALLQTLAMLE